MTAPFAALENRLNRAVFSHMSNADALLDGVPLAVLFERDYQRIFDGIASTSPVATAPSDSVASATTSSTMKVAGNTYRVRGIQPDGTGNTVLLLELQ